MRLYGPPICCQQRALQLFKYAVRECAMAACMRRAWPADSLDICVDGLDARRVAASRGSALCMIPSCRSWRRTVVHQEGCVTERRVTERLVDSISQSSSLSSCQRSTPARSVTMSAVTRSPAASPAASGCISYLLLLALALQYGLQPFLTARFLSSRAVDARATVLATELLKAALCGAALPSRRSRRSTTSLAAAAPAACYLLQNLALQRAYADLDWLTFNCLNQTKVVATALTLYLLMRHGQSPQQVLALLLIVLAGTLLQVTGEQTRVASGDSAGVASFRRGVAVRTLLPLTHSCSLADHSQACLFASALSGLASTLTQLILQARLSLSLSYCSHLLRRRVESAPPSSRCTWRS